MENEKHLILTRKAFWDVDFDKLIEQRDAYASFIVRKVFQFGTFEDVRSVTAYYGHEKVIDILKNAEYLPEITLHFASAVFKIDKTEFKCYTKLQQRPFSTKR